MKTVFLALVLLASAIFAKAQTAFVNIQNATPCPVHYELYAGICGNTQMLITSAPLTAAAGENSVWLPGTIPGIPTLPPGWGIIGMRVYSDNPASICSTITFIDVFAPTGGPLPALGGPLVPTCSACPPIHTFFETYCSSTTNIFRFF